MAAQPVAGAYQADIQSVQLLTPFGIYYPDRLKKLFGKVPRASALSWMMATGRYSKRTAHNFTYEFWEEGQYMKGAVTIASNAPNGGNAAWVDITLSTADHTADGEHSFPIPTNTVVFQSEIVGFIQAVDRTTPGAHIITVAPKDGSDDVNAAAIDTESLVVFSNAQTEDSDAPESRVPIVTKEENDIQTFRETFRVTDHEEKTQTWFTINGQPYLYVKGIEEAAERFELQIELAMLVGQRFSTVTFDSKDVKSTDGLIPTTRAKGEVVTYDKTTLTPDLDDWEAIILAIDKNYGPRDYFIGQGLDLDLKMNRFLVEFVSANQGGGLIDFSGGFSGGKEQALSLNIQAVNYSSHQFFLQKWDIMSHTDTLGAVGMPYRKMGVFIPIGKTKNPRVQYGTKNFEDYYQVVYIPPAGSPSEVRGTFKLWETGANAHPRATEGKLRREIHHACYKGFEMRNKEKYLLFEPEP